MTASLRAGLAALLLVPGLVGPAAADDLEHPLAHSRLSLVDGTKPRQRRIRFKARFAAGATMDNPSLAGSTIRVRGAGPTDGDSGTIELSGSRWRALLRRSGRVGYRYDDPSAAAGGIRRVMLRRTRQGGVLAITGGQANWHYAIGGAQGEITLTFTIGKGRWCTAFESFLENGPHRVRAERDAAPPSCPCERYDGTFEAIQNVVFARHGCTTSLCHGSAAQGGLDLRPEVAYDNLVDVFSSAGQMKRVEPGDQARSFLWRKLAKATLDLPGVPGAGMPNGLPPLPESELDGVRLWIRAGAPRTGVVGGSETLLAACLPPADPIEIRPPAPPAPEVGLQLHAPPWEIPAHGENEVCYATWFDYSAQIPDAAKVPCPDFWGGPSRTCFYYDRSELTQDPNSHHSLIHYYKGRYDISDVIYACRGGANAGQACDPAGSACGADGTCVGTPAFGPFTCRGGALAGTSCNPKGLGVAAPAGADCGPGGGCAGRVVSGVACIFYGPPDFGFDVTGTGSDNSPVIGGSQAPVSTNAYPPGVFSLLPVSGTIVWNSHAFNLTDQPATNEQWLNLYFAGAADRTHPVQGIFDSRDIFVQDVPPFEKREYCRTHTLPQGARLFQLSSHTHKRGELFRVWGPGITDQCGSERAVKPADCRPEAGPPILTTTQYSDPAVVLFDPPVALDGADPASRTYKFCARYDNGADDPAEVKRQSTSPRPPLFLAPGGPCADDQAACLGGPHQGTLCHGDDRACDSAPGAHDALCDACPLRGGVTTEDEMFILLGLYYVAR